MRPSRWQQLEEIFFAALESDPRDRQAFLERACGEDSDLRAEVEAVLSAHETIEAGEGPLPPPPEGLVGTRVGAYLLESRIGRGGMGDVYLARRADGEYEQEVAVKIVRSALPPQEMLRRFRLERQILARLEHPNVATLLDGGIAPGGQPYLAMQFVEGAPITDYADSHRLDVAGRLALFATVCRAVQFAHSNLVVHRDLKPSNILVTDNGQVRLLDFGIAKLLDPEGTSAAEATRSLLVMTPEHAAPEQFLGLPVTTATDVYQLGVLLYELLTGHRPFDAAGPTLVHRAVCEVEPARPSTAVGRSPGSPSAAPDTVAEADAARARATTPDALRRKLRGDLDWIALKALRKDPERRYESAASMADDVERHLGGFPVRARPESLGYVVGRFVRRHRAGVAASLALAASLVVLAVVSVRFAATSARHAEEIAAERDVALELASFLESLFQASDPFAVDAERRDTLSVQTLLAEGQRRIRTELVDQPLVQARLLLTLGRAYRNLGRLDEARPLLEEAAAIQLQAGGPGTPELARAQVNLAQLLMAQGDLDEAPTLLEQAVATLEGDTVAYAQTLADALSVLGNLLQEQGSYTEAERRYRRAVAVAEADPSADGADRSQHLANLATSLRNQGRWGEAEELLERALAEARAGYGADHPSTAGILNNLGLVVREQERLEDAEPYLREALAIREARLDSLHPQTAVSVNNLADLLLARDDLEGAEAYFLRSLEMRRAIYGEGHPAVAVGLNNLAAVLERTDRPEEARRLYRESLDILVATVGSEHPIVGGLQGNLGRLHHAQGDHERALPHLQSALEVRSGAFDRTHPAVLGTLIDVGRCLTDLGRLDEAEESLSSAYRGLEPVRDQHARLWGSVLTELARLHRDLDQPDEAARYESMRSDVGG